VKGSLCPLQANIVYITQQQTDFFLEKETKTTQIFSTNKKRKETMNKLVVLPF
jgi:uncharacterized membrane protein YjjP (DUF1212 family)